MFKDFEQFSISVQTKILVIKVGIHEMLVRIANRDVCLSLFWQATSVQNFKTLNISRVFHNMDLRPLDEKWQL